ncbi:MAG TPA: CopD family protein [bacterium]
MLYLLLKSLHIVAVISWMAGLLYLYRLFVYHRAETEAVVMARFQVMERRLWRAITVPAAWVTVLSGGTLIALQPCLYLPNGWMQLKLLLVLGLLHTHFKAGRYRKAFEQPPFPGSERGFRFLNEVPTLLMIGIVLLVIVRPAWWVLPFCR